VTIAKAKRRLLLTFATSSNSRVQIIFKHSDGQIHAACVGVVALMRAALPALPIAEYPVVVLQENVHMVKKLSGFKTFDYFGPIWNLTRFGSLNASAVSESLGFYAVLSYVLGVGDRHGGNMLINSQGEFLHVDYDRSLGTDFNLVRPLICVPSAIRKLMSVKDEAVFLHTAMTTFQELQKHRDAIELIFAVLIPLNVVIEEGPVLSSEHIRNLRHRMSDEIFFLENLQKSNKFIVFFSLPFKIS
jgi:hypothetical protein